MHRSVGICAGIASKEFSPLFSSLCAGVASTEFSPLLSPVVGAWKEEVVKLLRTDPGQQRGSPPLAVQCQSFCSCLGRELSAPLSPKAHQRRFNQHGDLIWGPSQAKPPVNPSGEVVVIVVEALPAPRRS